MKATIRCIYTYGLLMLCIMCKNAYSQNSVLPLDSEWRLYPSGSWTIDGKLIASGGFDEKNSVVCEIPSTVFAALVKAGKYKDPYFSDNLSRISSDWFKGAWKYSKVFNTGKEQSALFATLNFEGINYAADIILNGKKIASSDTLKGAFRRFEIEVTGKLNTGNNELEVIVYPPKAGDFTIGFVDWAPHAPDENMGLWRGVSLRFSGPVSVNNTFVSSKVNGRDAALSVECLAVNHSNNQVKAIISSKIENKVLQQVVDLKPLEKKLIRWTPDRFPELNFKNARLWWPHTMGKAELYSAEIECSINNSISDKVTKTFGIREITDYINGQGYRMYRINGSDIQIRSGGWTDDLLMRESKANIEAQVNYTKHMYLNCIRLEGFWGSSETLYDICDREGVLLMVGWSCQWEWEEYVGKACDDFGGVKTPDEIELIARSLGDQVKWLRNHPSVYVWVLGSDKLPRPELEKRYLSDLKLYDPSRPSLMACKLLNSDITGTTGVKMAGPYEYVSPNYWYLDKENGGAFGFNTETGPGPQIPVIETVKKMIPEDKLWPVNNDIWQYHCGRNEFRDLDRFLNALNHRYGNSSNLDEFIMKAQLSNYEAIRPMFEGFVINKANAGGIVQWMLNAMWPKFFWQLYDYYLTPTSAFYGTRNALKPLNLIYNYGNHGIYASNDFHEQRDDLKAVISIYDLQSKLVHSKEIPLSLAPYTSVKIDDLPEPAGVSKVYFADLRIVSTKEGMISDNFYWLSKQADVPDFKNSEWFYTPLKEYADFTALTEMPKADIQTSYTSEQSADESILKVSVENKSDKIAFFLELKCIGKKSGDLILPVLWSDNYISLLPGEKRELKVIIKTKDCRGDIPDVVCKGFNAE